MNRIRVSEAARRVNLHPDTLKRAARRGELEMVRAPNGLWLVTEAELERWVSTPRVHENLSGVSDVA